MLDVYIPEAGIKPTRSCYCKYLFFPRTICICLMFIWGTLIGAFAAHTYDPPIRIYKSIPPRADALKEKFGFLDQLC